MPLLAEWDSFYVIVGSAAGALIGLQFVVITLIADRPVRAAEAGAAFATPTIVHFSVVLLLSALLRAPWHAIAVPAALCVVIGVVGTVYAAGIVRRMRIQTVYKPDGEDWLCYCILPLAAYATLGLSSGAIFFYPEEALFGVGGATLLLLFTGIHNAWDSASYHVLTKKKDAE